MKYELGEGITKETIDGCIVFLCENGDAATVNLMGSRIVEKLLSAGENEMFEKIGQQYTGFPDHWQDEIKRFIGQLLQYGLIVQKNEC